MKNTLILCLFLVIFSNAETKGGTESDSVPTLRVPTQVSLEIFNPSEAEDFATVRVLQNLGEGLTVLDKNLNPQLGLAEGWTMSRDKKTFTFKLKRAFWSDGQPITAEDFVNGLEHSFSPKTVGKLSIYLLDLIVGAKDYKSKKITDFKNVGVKAIDPETLEFKLTHPSGYFLSLLSSPVAFPQRNFVLNTHTPTSGPYVLAELKAGSKILLRPNPHYARPPHNQVELRYVGDGSTMISLYEKNELDVVEHVPSHDFIRFKSNPELVSAPWLATYYIGFRINQKPFDDKTARQAFVEAIDRGEIGKILQDPQLPASSWVPSPLETSNKKYGPPFDPKHARKLWGKLSDTIDKVELVFDAQDKNILIASFIQQQIKKNLNFDITLKSMEWKTYLKYLTDEHPSFFRFAWLASFPDPLNHLSVFTSDNPNNYTGFADPAYDKMVARIAETPAGGLRTKLIERAQRKLLTENIVIMPLYHYRQYALFSRRWQGLDLTPLGLVRFDQARLRPSP